MLVGDEARRRRLERHSASVVVASSYDFVGEISPGIDVERSLAEHTLDELVPSPTRASRKNVCSRSWMPHTAAA